MDIKQIYDKISELAQKNFEDGTVLTRSDLAWELKNAGIENDSPEISKFVWECFQKSSNKDIFKSLVNNEKTSPLINEYQIPALLESGETEDVFSVLTKKLSSAQENIFNLENLSSEKLKLDIIRQTSDLLNFVSGKGAVEKIQSEASQIFKKYSAMTEAYKGAKNSVKEITKDFLNLRQTTAELYRRYAVSLTDVFGENIKSSMPEMFDFDSIEFLDTDSMLKNVELAYNSVFSKCGELAGKLSDEFVGAVKFSAGQIGALDDKRLGLVIAGVNMISHYIKTNRETSALKKEVQELKNSVSADAAAIKTDEVRLAEIFKTLNDVLIPKAEIFAKAAPEVFNAEFNELTDSVYSTPELKKLKNERDEILKELHVLEARIADEMLNVSYYSGHLKDCKATMESLEKQYNEAKKSKPEAPSGFGNVISLGSKKKQYERAVYDWNKNCAPLVSKYEDMIVDVKIDGDELQSQQQALEKDKTRYEVLKNKQKQISERLSTLITSNPEVKAKIVSRLDDIIKLLHIAKDISSSKLDETLVHKTEVKKFEEIELPENLAGAVNDFKRGIKDTISKSEHASLLLEGFDLCERLVQLEAMKMSYRLSEEHYDTEFKKIKAAFDEKMKSVDNQNVELMEIAKKINSAAGKDELKKGLFMLLGKDSESFSAEDWDGFLSGKKTIEI